MKIYSLILLLFLITGLEAQIKYPRISPVAKIEQQLGLSSISVEYSRPAARGRQIIGEVVPYDRIWRVGANESTKFTTDGVLDILGNTLQPGTYALYAFPAIDSWEVAFHNNTEHWGDGREAYDPSEDVFRVVVKPEPMNEFRENFLILFDRIDHNQMEMIWEWERTRIRIPISTDTDLRMKEEISRQISENPTAQTYYEAARYLLEQRSELPAALAYTRKAIELDGDTYYYYRVKSMLEAALGQYEAAIESANRSMELADALGKDEFVRMNKTNITRWKELSETEK